MKLAVVELIDVTIEQRNRELTEIRRICEELEIDYQEFPVNVLPVGDWFDPDTVCIVRGSVKNRKMWLDKITEMEYRGCTMINTRNCIEVCNDKYRTYLALNQVGLHQPNTVLVPSEYDNLIDHVIQEAGLQYPMVLKTLEGSYGVGVALMESTLGLKGVIQAMNTRIDWDGAILQEYIPHSGDIRAHVVDNEIFGSMFRTPPPGDFRTNIARGGQGIVCELTELEKEHCKLAANAVGARWCGVDFIPSDDRENISPKIIEVNCAAETGGLEAALAGKDDEESAPLLRKIIEHFMVEK